MTTGDANLCARARRGGFTLIEVMLAVVIIGLGVLGLSALFAGAAAQQKRSTEDNLSVSLARNGEALLSRTIGEMEGPDLLDLNQFIGQWLPTRSSASDPTLTPQPFLTSGAGSAASSGMYALVDAPGTTLYTAPGTMAQLGVARSDHGFFQANPIAPIPDSRLHPSSVLVTFTIGRELTDTTTGTTHPPEYESHVFRPADPQPDDLRRQPYRWIVLQRDSDTPSPAIPSNHDSFTPSGVFSNTAPLVVVNLADPAPQLGRTATIASFDMKFGSVSPPINFTQVEWIESIAIEPYRWRNSRLTSLNDRLVYETDVNFPGGRRPTMGYTMLFRLLPSGSTQFTLFTYALQATGVPARNAENLPFIPPEHEQNAENPPETALLRLADLTLGYDEATEQHYVEGAESDPVVAAALTPGQILLMKESVGLDLLDPTYRGGSDIPVRVVSQRRMPNGDLRGVLDRSPRVGGRSPVGTYGQATGVRMWALNPLVKSLTSDGTEWRVRPVDARQFQVDLSFN